MRTKTTAAALAAITLIGLTGCGSSPKEPTISPTSIDGLYRANNDEIDPAAVAARCGDLLGDAPTFFRYVTGKKDKQAAWKGDYTLQYMKCTPTSVKQNVPAVSFYFSTGTAEMAAENANGGFVHMPIGEPGAIGYGDAGIQTPKKYGQLDEEKTKALMEKIAKATRDRD